MCFISNPAICLYSVSSSNLFMKSILYHLYNHKYKIEIENIL
jgi:hypothetical protein